MTDNQDDVNLDSASQDDFNEADEIEKLQDKIKKMSEADAFIDDSNFDDEPDEPSFAPTLSPAPASKFIEPEAESSSAIDEKELISFMESKVKLPDEKPGNAVIDKPAANPSKDPDKEVAMKKYVVMATPSNVDYFENLSVDERSDLFNELLGEHIKNEPFKKGKKRFIHILIHVLIAVATAMIVMPIAFYVVSKSVEMTIKNYRGTQVNFERLYETHGILPGKSQKSED